MDPKLRKINNNLLVCDMEEFYYIRSTWSDITDNERIEYLVSQCKKYSNSGSTIIGVMVIECEPVHTWISRVETFANMLLDIGREFIFVTSQFNILPHVNFETIYIQYFLIQVWFESVGRKHNCGFRNKWNYNSTEFLFLTGKANKKQRIRLLYKLVKSGLIDNAMWSLFVPEAIYKHCKELLPELSDNEYNTFVNTYKNSPDLNKNRSSMHFGKAIPPPNIDPLFELVPESSFSFNKTVHITDKTWKPIINHAPFLIVGDTGTLDVLENMGFNTFREYLQFPEYNNINDQEDKLDLIIKNIEHWYSSYEKYITEINKDVNYNFEIFKKYVNIELEKLSQLNIRFKLKYYSPYDLISCYQVHDVNKWLIFYDSIKDESWPPCVYEDEFEFLPKNIQNECIEIFGYDPKNRLN